MWEKNFLFFVHSHGTPFLDQLFIVTHFIGTTLFFTILVTSAIVWHLLRRERREVFAWLAVGISTYCVKSALKTLLAVPRPELWTPLVQETGYAFPSGHALGAAALYPLLAYTIAERSSGKASLWFGLAAAIAFLVGFGRLYLGVHWPTDVIAGWALGTALSLPAILILRRRSHPSESTGSG